MKDSLPAAYTPFIGVRRGHKCLASGPRGEVRNRFEASAEENVPYGKINASSNVNSNPKQTQQSNMGSIPGKHKHKCSGVNCKSRD